MGRLCPCVHTPCGLAKTRDSANIILWHNHDLIRWWMWLADWYCTGNYLGNLSCEWRTSKTNNYSAKILHTHQLLEAQFPHDLSLWISTQKVGDLELQFPFDVLHVWTLAIHFVISYDCWRYLHIDFGTANSSLEYSTTALKNCTKLLAIGIDPHIFEKIRSILSQPFM